MRGGQVHLQIAMNDMTIAEVAATVPVKARPSHAFAILVHEKLGMVWVLKCGVVGMGMSVGDEYLVLPVLQMVAHIRWHHVPHAIKNM